MIGKKVKYKNDSTTSHKTITEVKDDWVYFSDNGRIPLSSFYEKFEIVELVKENLEKPYTKIYTETKVNKMNDDIINPDDFFASSSNTTRSIFNNPVSEADVRTNNPTYTQPSMTDYGQDYSKLNPNTIRDIERDLARQKEIQEGKVQELEASIVDKHNDPFFEKSFENAANVRKIDSDKDKELLENIRKFNNGESKIDPYAQKSTNTVNNNAYSNQETNKKVMKKTLKVKLKLEFDEMIPKIETLRALEDLYETSIIEELAKEIVDRYITNRDLLEGMFIAELERIVIPKKTKKKPVKRKPVVKKAIIKNEDK